MGDNREEHFRAGLEILVPFFEARDFQLAVLAPCADDEGTYCSARFTWGNHAVTLIHSEYLDSVTYSVGAMSIEHGAYLDALGVRMGAAFPVSADDALAGYRALLSDLETRMAPFFEEPDREFMEIATTRMSPRAGASASPTRSSRQR